MAPFDMPHHVSGITFLCILLSNNLIQVYLSLTHLFLFLGLPHLLPVLTLTNHNSLSLTHSLTHSLTPSLKLPLSQVHECLRISCRTGQFNLTCVRLLQSGSHCNQPDSLLIWVIIPSDWSCFRSNNPAWTDHSDQTWRKCRR